MKVTLVIKNSLCVLSTIAKTRVVCLNSLFINARKTDSGFYSDCMESKFRTQVQEESGFNVTEGIKLLSRNVMWGHKILHLNQNKAVV